MTREEAVKRIKELEAEIAKLKRNFKCPHKDVRCPDCHGYASQEPCEKLGHGTAWCKDCDKLFNAWYCPESSNGFCSYDQNDICNHCGLPNDRP